MGNSTQTEPKLVDIYSSDEEFSPRDPKKTFQQRQLTFENLFSSTEVGGGDVDGNETELEKLKKENVLLKKHLEKKDANRHEAFISKEILSARLKGNKREIEGLKRENTELKRVRTHLIDDLNIAANEINRLKKFVKESRKSVLSLRDRNESLVLIGNEGQEKKRSPKLSAKGIEDIISSGHNIGIDLSDGHNMMELSFDEKNQSGEDNVHFNHTPSQKEKQSNFHISSNSNNIYSHVTPQQSRYYEETHIPFIITPYPDSNEVKKTNQPHYEEEEEKNHQLLVNTTIKNSHIQTNFPTSNSYPFPTSPDEQYHEHHKKSKIPPIEDINEDFAQWFFNERKGEEQRYKEIKKELKKEHVRNVFLDKKIKRLEKIIKQQDEFTRTYAATCKQMVRLSRQRGGVSPRKSGSYSSRSSHGVS